MTSENQIGQDCQPNQNQRPKEPYYACHNCRWKPPETYAEEESVRGNRIDVAAHKRYDIRYPEPYLIHSLTPAPSREPLGKCRHTISRETSIV